LYPSSALQSSSVSEQTIQHVRSLPPRSLLPYTGEPSCLLSDIPNNAIGAYVPTCIWTNIEVHIGIVTASLPTIWPLLRAFATHFIRTVANPSKSLGLPSSSTIYTPTEPAIASFLSCSRRSGNSNNKNNTTDDEEAFVQLENIRPVSLAPSSGQDAVAKRASSDERRPSMTEAVMGKPEEMAGSRIQVSGGWTVSVESHIGMEQHGRSWVKLDG
jgi:hypothetical protein